MSQIFTELFETAISLTILVITFINFSHKNGEFINLYVFAFFDITIDIMALIFQINVLTHITCVFTLLLLIMYAKSMKKLLVTDNLTGAYTRSYLSIMHIPTHGSILYIDIDNFKFINDTFGHSAGDIVLQRLVSILKTSTGHLGFCIRMGGDEFLIVSKLSKEVVEMKINSLIQKDNKKNNVQFSISIGGFDYENSESINCLIEKADSLMYKCKHEHNITQDF